MVRTVSTKVSRVVFARMESGEDIIRTIEKVAIEYGIKTGQLMLIGAISKAQLGYFERECNEYKKFSVEKDLEVVSCIGNISIHDNDVIIHAHMVAADENGTCYGGHLLQGCEVSVTIELAIFEFEKIIKRSKDPSTGLNLMNLS